MKRFLALFAIIAMIGSMFAGVALAQPEDDRVKVYVSVDKEIIPFGAGFSYSDVTGKIFNDETDALYQIDAELKIYQDNGNGVYDGEDVLIDTFEADDGEFEVTIMTNETHGIGEYFVVGTNSDTYKFDRTEVGEVAYDSFSIMYEIELSEPDELEWAFPVEGQVVVQGIFVNEDADADDDVTIEYKDGTWVADASFNDDEAFGFLFNGSQFVKTGEIGIYINGVLALEGEILPEELDVTLSPKEAVRILEPTTFTATFDLDDEYLNGVDLRMADGYKIRYTVEDPDENEWSTVTIINDKNLHFTDYSDLEVEFDIMFTDAHETGEYVFTIDLFRKGDKYVVAKKDITIKVINPKKYNLVGWDLDDHDVGDIVFVLPGSEGEGEQLINVVKYTGGEANACEYVEVIVEGCGVDEDFATFDDEGLIDGLGTFKVSPDETGIMEVTINVYTDEEDDTADFSVTKEVEIEGWNIKINPDEVLVGFEGDVVFTITDEDGDPVNNAIIVIDDEVVVDGTKTNIRGGVYTYEEDEQEVFTNVRSLPVSFWTASEWHDEHGNPEIFKSSGIEVIGEEVYDVESDTPVLLNGVEETILISVLDENGDIVYPTFERIDVDDEGDKSDAEDIPNGDLGSFKDLDGIDGKEARQITLTPTADQTAVIIRALTDDGEKMGEVYIEVQKPQVVMTGVSTLTENFEQTVVVQLIDPRDDSTLEFDFDLVDNSDYFDWDHEEDWEFEDDIYSLDVLIDDVDWDEAEDDEEEVVLDLVMEGDNDVEVTVLEIPIGEATLTSDPEKVVINTATNLTLTYLDAEGNPLEDYEIMLDEEEIAETDENGQVFYAAASTSSVALKFTGETDVKDDSDTEEDETAYTELTVKSAADTVPPVATAPATVLSNTALITISDNVRVHKALVNGAPVDIFFPMPEVSYIASVVPGNNTFVVEAVDINNNYSKTVLTVNYDKPVTFTIGVMTPLGAPELVAGTTMVPVRFAEDLGAIVGWDNVTKTATYTYGDVTVSVTVGSTTAIVNGVNVQMTQAPFINEQGRVMVPLRMIAQELGFNVLWTSNTAPISIAK